MGCKAVNVVIGWLSWDASLICGWRAVTKANHPSILASILPEARDTIRAPASNCLPSLSIRALWCVLTAGGITGRWPSISRKTSLKSSDYFLIISSCLIRATPYSLQSRNTFKHTDLSSALSLCLPGLVVHITWKSMSSLQLCYTVEVNFRFRKVIRQFGFWSSCLYTQRHTYVQNRDTVAPRDMCVLHAMRKGMFLGFGFHHAALLELTILIVSNLCLSRR